MKPPALATDRLRPYAGLSGAVAAAALVWGVLGAHPDRAVAALAASWLFFAGAAAGALAASALLALVGAGWSSPLDRMAARLARYLPFAAAILIVLAALTVETRGLGGGAAVFFFVREVVCSVALFAVGRLTLRAGATAAVRIGYLLLFAVVGSIWAFDYVVLPSPGFSSTLAGPHLFVGAFVSGVGFMVIGALRAGTLDRHQRRDAASLLVALAIFWAYLFWSQLLTLWYGNLPDEVAFLARRDVHGWSIVVLVVVAATLVVPFLSLLGAAGKASTRVVTLAAASQLLGLWLERQLLVVPAADASATPFDLPGALVQLGMVGVFVATTWPWAEDVSAGAAAPARPR